MADAQSPIRFAVQGNREISRTRGRGFELAGAGQAGRGGYRGHSWVAVLDRARPLALVVQYGLDAERGGDELAVAVDYEEVALARIAVGGQQGGEVGQGEGRRHYAAELAATVVEGHRGRHGLLLVRVERIGFAPLRAAGYGGVAVPGALARVVTRARKAHGARPAVGTDGPEDQGAVRGRAGFGDAEAPVGQALGLAVFPVGEAGGQDG